MSMVGVPALISTDILWGSFHEAIVQGTKDLWSLMRRRQATSALTRRDQSIILMDTACLLPPHLLSPSAPQQGQGPNTSKKELCTAGLQPSGPQHARVSSPGRRKRRLRLS